MAIARRFVLKNASRANYMQGLASGSVLVSINELTLHRARLALAWVTVSGVKLPMQEAYLSV